jgi:membrane protease YdiL (CAAX protease family)
MDVKENSNNSFPWKYFIITFTFSWIIWLPGIFQSRGIISTPLPAIVIFIIGGFGPFISSFYLTSKKESKPGVKRLWKRAFNFKIPLKWLAFIFLLPVCIAGISLYLKIQSGGEKPDFQLTNPIAIIVTFLFLFFLGGSFAEEFGWRGYALDRLQKKWNALVSSLLLGFIWGLWHLPLFFAEGLSQSYLPFWGFLVWTMSLSIFFTLFHNNTNGNILAALLFHTMTNLSLSLFPFVEMKHNGDQRGFIYSIIIYAVVSIIVVLIWGPGKLSRKLGEKKSQ